MTTDTIPEFFDCAGIVRHRDAWDALVARALEPSVFAEPDFLLAAARHLTSRPPVFVTVWERSAGANRLIALCPVRLPRWPHISPAAVWTHVQATAAYPLLDRERAGDALRTMLQAIGTTRGLPGALLMQGLAQDGPTAALLGQDGGTAVWLNPRPRAVLVRDGVRPGLGGSGRKELRRQWNRLAERGDLRFASATSPGDAERAIDCFLALEARGWKGRAGTALAGSGRTQAFAREALSSLFASGRCRIDSLSLGDTWIAAGIVLRSADRAFFWKTAYDEGHARFSPGLQLAARLTDMQGQEAGISVTDSCAIPGHSMIDRLWPERWQIGDALVATDAAALAAFGRACTVERTRRRLVEHLKRMARRVNPR